MNDTLLEYEMWRYLVHNAPKGSIFHGVEIIGDLMVVTVDIGNPWPGTVLLVELVNEAAASCHTTCRWGWPHYGQTLKTNQLIKPGIRDRFYLWKGASFPQPWHSSVWGRLTDKAKYTLRRQGEFTEPWTPNKKDLSW